MMEYGLLLEARVVECNEVKVPRLRVVEVA